MRYFRRIVINGEKTVMAVGSVGIHGSLRIEYPPTDGHPFEINESVPAVEKIEPTFRLVASDLPRSDHSSDHMIGAGILLFLFCCAVLSTVI